MGLNTGNNNSTKPAEATQDRAEQTRERAEQTRTRDEAPATPRRNISRAFSAGEGVQGRSAEFYRAAKEILEENKDPNILVLQPDGDLSRKLSDSFGYVIFCNRIDADMMWHLFVFESKKLPVAQLEVKDRHNRSRNSEPVYNFEAPTDAVDDSIIRDFEDWLEVNVSIQGKFYYTNVTVVPTEVDLTQESVIRSLCNDGEDSNILLACVDEPFSAKMLNNNSILRANLNFSPEERVDLTMMPLRSDFQLEVCEITRDKQANSMRNSGDKRTLISVDGYVNARWVGHNEPGRDGQLDLACYVPEVVATQSNPYHAGIFGGNYERSLLGLASMVYLQDGDIFLKGFEPNMHSDIPLSSLAYGMDPSVFQDGKVPSDLDVIDEDPSKADKWLSSIFHNDTKSRKIPVEYAILIKEGGVGYATTKLLLDVADEAEGALEKLKDVLYNLTGGVSEDLMDIRSASDVIAGQVRLPMGYFTTKNGNKAAEYIDHRFMIDRLQDNYPTELDDYFECLQLEDREFTPAESMTKLISLYQLATQNSFTLKGMGTKLYLQPSFMEGLAASIKDKDSKLNLELDANVELNFTRTHRRQGRHASFGMSSSPLQRQRRTHSHESSRSSGNRYRR